MRPRSILVLTHELPPLGGGAGRAMARLCEALQARGLAKGGSLENAIVLDNQGVINPQGLRWADEFVRHKCLDALGDLVTLEMPLMGHVVLYKAGHDVMNKLVRKIIDTPSCYRHIELGAEGCSFDARFDGDKVTFPGALPDACAKLCSRRASYAGLEASRLSGSAAEASAMRDAGGKRLCGD